MNSLKIKLKFKRFKPGGLWAELRAACQVYFVWAAMLAFGLGVALRELGVSALPAVGLPAALVLVGLAATAALLANRPVCLLPAFLLLGLAWSGLAELRLTSFAVPPDEAVFFRGRVVQVLEREENAFDALADAPRNGYSFVMQGEDQNGWRGRLLIVTAPLRPKAGDCLQVSGLVLDQSRTHNFSLSERDYLRSQSVAAAVRPVPQGLSFSRLAAPYSLPNLGLAVRQRVFAAMEPLPPLQQALLKGIGFGETGMLTNGQSSVLAQSGIMHLFAVSGLHVGYVTLLAAWLLRGLGRLLPLPGWLRFLVLVALVFLPGGWANSLRSAGRGDDAGRLAGFGWRARWAQRLRFNFGRLSVVALAAGVVARAWFFTVFSGYGGHFVHGLLVAGAGA